MLRTSTPCLEWFYLLLWWQVVQTNHKYVPILDVMLADLAACGKADKILHIVNGWLVCAQCRSHRFTLPSIWDWFVVRPRDWIGSDMQGTAESCLGKESGVDAQKHGNTGWQQGGVGVQATCFFEIR